jgi:3-hydroxy-9,10-secoandrosta-1,3,5(10)-triene-9,17-dione monooxygenase reductase component
MTSMSGEFDSKHFRTVLGHLPTGVSVVTGVNREGVKWGITIGSVVSVSLVGFFPGVGSTSWPQIEQGGGFCVNVLTASQDELCWRFAKEPTDGGDRFDGVPSHLNASGMPVLEGTLAQIDCSIESVTPAGDHYFVLGRVRELALDVTAGDAMVFYKSAVTGVVPPTPR